MIILEVNHDDSEQDLKQIVISFLTRHTTIAYITFYGK